MHRSHVFKSKSKLQGSNYRIQELFSDKITQERSFQPLIEKAIREEKRFYVRYNKLIIDDAVYMSDYESNTVNPIWTELFANLKRLGGGGGGKMAHS